MQLWIFFGLNGLSSYLVQIIHFTLNLNHFIRRTDKTLETKQALKLIEINFD